MPRRNVLSPSEQEQFDTPPVFTSAQRKRFFDFPLGIRELAADLPSPVGTVGFLVGYGYFNSSKRFFLPQHYHQRDRDYVARQLGLRENLSLASLYHPRTRRHHQQVILEYCGCRPFDQTASGFVTREIQSMVRSHLKLKLIFWRCVDILTLEKIQIPRYYGIARLIITALNDRKDKLSTIIRAELTTETKALLYEQGLDWQIRPNKYVHVVLIQENWDDILRFVTTIKLKEITASDMFRRRNSYSKQNVLYKALKAFGQIIKSLFILRYLYDLQLRRNIQKQLNKVEQPNRFTRAIAVGNPR